VGVECGGGTFMCPVVVQIKIRTFRGVVKFKTWIIAHLSSGLSSPRVELFLDLLTLKRKLLRPFYTSKLLQYRF
jgi:hypothetical protein